MYLCRAQPTPPTHYTLSLHDALPICQEAAYVLSVFGRYTESLALVEEARRIYQQIGDGGREARTIVNRGILSRYTGDLDGARSEEQRLNSSHSQISYAVFCLKKKRNT